MAPSFHFSCLSFSLLILIHVGATSVCNSANTTVNLVEETCKKAADEDPNLTYKFCVTSLQAVPKSNCTNLKELGLISMKLTKTNATHTKSYIKKLLKQKNMDPFYKSCLKSCLELYSNAVYSIKDAVKYYKGKHYLEANIEMSAVMDASTTCEDGFKEKEGVQSPLTKKDKDMFQLTALALSIIEMLH
ncbi:Pectinesterase inhibitor domain [Macleaya cordata]|uniref:Pectinesterase inhibitor domain n=1 Tax=Macleaya cordata TaxID=56857 RepID=A0A200PW95_MACCD|nr:Pectinesterase inhibitor domain [Macleaya cordata]